MSSVCLETVDFGARGVEARAEQEELVDFSSRHCTDAAPLPGPGATRFCVQGFVLDLD